MSYKDLKKRTGHTMGGSPITLLGEEITIGQKASNFQVLKNDLSPLSLSDVGDKVKLISVVPSIDTGVCELQTIRFNEEATALGDNVIVITISCDLPFAQARFCGVKGIDRAEIVSDHKDLDFGKKYGFLIEELRLLNRGILVLDQNNIVQYVEYVSENTDHPDYDKALDAVKKLI